MGAAPTGDPCPRISVIIPVRNMADELARCLASLAAQQLCSGTAEIIVVDNGSTVPLDALKSAFPNVRFLSELTPGPGPARNHGIAAAHAPVLAFIDADCRAAAGWLQAAVDAVEADPAQPVGGDVAIDFVDPNHPTPIEAYESVFGFRQSLYIAKKGFSVTANLAVSARVAARIGGFAGIDTAEDLDWGRRGAAAGHPVRFCPAMRVLHPARRDLAALEHKWQRLIRHEWTAHCAAGRPRWHWRLRAAALVAAVPFEMFKPFFSLRISGFATCASAIPILARIRWSRAREMHRIAAGDADVETSFWAGVE